MTRYWKRYKIVWEDNGKEHSYTGLFRNEKHARKFIESRNIEIISVTELK